MMSQFICFIGIDGSGKTSQAKMLMKTLRQMGIKCKYVWGRWTPFMLKPFEIALNRIYFKGKKIDYNNYNEYVKEKQRLIQNYKLALIWENLVLFDYFIQFFIKIKLPLLLGITVICDRYIYDTLIDIIVDFKFSGKEIKRMLQSRLLSLFPKPNLTFLLDVPERIACQRKRDLRLMNYISKRRKTYLHLSQTFQAVIVSNTRNIFNVQKSIFNFVKLIILNGHN